MLGKLLGIELPEITMGAEPLFHLGPITVTNTILTTWLAMAFLITVAIIVNRRLSLVPGGLQNLVELVIETLYNLVIGVAGEDLGKRIFPLIATLFLFILTANWMGLLPGFATLEWRVEHHGEIKSIPLLRPANSDLNTTLAMALVTVILVQVAGIAYKGVKGYLKEFVTPAIMAPLMAPIHLISELSHILSLSARLFGNIFGGDVVMLVIFVMLPPLIPAVFMLLESLFGLIQAIIFAVLSLAYFTIAAAHQAEH